MQRSLATTSLLLAMIGACARPAPDPVAPAAPPPLPPPPALSSEVDGEPAEISLAVLHGLLREGAIALVHDDTGLPMGRLRYRICLDPAGTATVAPWPVTMPAHQELDRRIQATIAAWRFRPLVRDGAAIAACSNVSVDIAMSARPGPETTTLLPPARIELPAPTVLPMPRPPGVARPPTPGVGIVVHCLREGADTASVASLVQTSGDDAVDARALHERQSRSAHPTEVGALACEAIATIAGVMPSSQRDVPPTSPEAPTPAAGPGAVIVPRVLEAQRIEGDPRIMPSPSIKQAIADSGLAQFVISVKVCIGPDGRIRAVSILQSSGFLSYDIELLNAIGGWRYRPFMVNGEPAPVCSIVKFMYRQV